MKKLLLSFIAVLFISAAAICQDGSCEPSQDVPADTAGVYPPPYEPTTSPNGGIKESACIGKPYKYVFTVVVSDSITISILGNTYTFPLDSVVVANVDGLPIGISYACDPTNCHFKRSTINCATIYGTATDANPPGTYPLVIQGLAYFNSSPQGFPITFPGDQFPGKYDLILEPMNGTTCFIWSGTSDRLQDKIALQAKPNPASNFVQIQVNSGIAGTFNLRLMDLVGTKMELQTVEIVEGTSTFGLDASHLPNGMYLL
ncbi:MAG: T9SS type A sorting domain-containing protein, partial [Bacteroidota bacterium]